MLQRDTWNDLSHAMLANMGFLKLNSLHAKTEASKLGREINLSSLTKFVITFPMDTPAVQHVGKLSTTRSSTPTMSFRESGLSDGPAYLSLLRGSLWFKLFPTHRCGFAPRPRSISLTLVSSVVLCVLCGSSFSQLIAVASHHARAPSPLPKSSLCSLCSLWFKLCPTHRSGFAPRPRSISLTY